MDAREIIEEQIKRLSDYQQKVINDETFCDTGKVLQPYGKADKILDFSAKIVEYAEKIKGTQSQD